MLGEIEGGNISEEEKSTLSELGFIVANSRIEREEMRDYIDDVNGMSRVFAAKVAMNLDCNLACKYCFEGLRKGKFYMTRETADLFIEFVEKIVLSGKEEIMLTFYGGEPLLSLDLIAYISEKTKMLAEDNGLTYHGAIITNGTLLTPGVVKRLKMLGIGEAAVTLDGPAEIHNNFRPFKAGRGSFDLIIKNLKEACGIMEIQLNGNFTRENYRNFPMLLDFLTETGLTADKISMVRFGPVTKESKGIALPDFHDGCDSFNEPWLQGADVYLREEILRHGYKTYKLVPGICSLDMKDHMLVNHDGNIYKCPGLIGRTEFKAGDVITGLKNIGNAYNPDNWKNEECLDCCYLPLCFGGCRYMRLVREGTMDGVDCRKSYFDSVLETLISQNIKYDL